MNILIFVFDYGSNTQPAMEKNGAEMKCLLKIILCMLICFD